jgi:multimeric flavodoxin WrbA
MSLAIFNGSPRGHKSNSNVIASWFLNGYKKDHKIYYLNKVKQHETYIEESTEYDEYLFVMPLYVDGMPGQVKNFCELMYKNIDKFTGKKVTYILHSGFAEGIQSRSLETYFNRFSDLLKFKNSGVVIIPGSEGFRLMPPQITKKKNEIVTTIGRDFMNSVDYDPNLLKKLIKKESTSKFGAVRFKLFAKLGLTNFYWNSVLKKNKAYDKRFDAPYNESPFRDW